MSEQMREKFEAWVVRYSAEKNYNWPELVLNRDDSDGYVTTWVDSAWIGWQASRAALVVKLPSRVDAKPYACYEGGWNDMHDEAREAIEAAGVKVKS